MAYIIKDGLNYKIVLRAKIPICGRRKTKYYTATERRDWFLVKYGDTDNEGRFNLGVIGTPKELIGKRIKISVEVIEDTEIIPLYIQNKWKNKESLEL